MCGSRMPVASMAILLAIATLRGAFRSRAPWIVVVVALMMLLAVSRVQRYQRFVELADAQVVQDRVAGSVHAGFFELVEDYPLGRGLGTGWGTSIPGFLQQDAPVPIGMESEFARILVELGILGLLVWLGFMAWVSWKPLLPHRVPLAPAYLVGQAGLIAWFATGLVGAGLLYAVPTAAIGLYVAGMISASSGYAEDAEVVR